MLSLLKYVFVLFTKANLLLLLGEKDGVDVGQHTTGRDGHTSEKFVELLIVAHGQLDVARDDAGALVVAGSVSGKLEDFSGQVFHDGGHVHGGTRANAGGVASTAQVPGDTSDGELKSSASRSRSGFASLLATSSFTFSGHFVSWFCVGFVCG